MLFFFFFLNWEIEKQVFIEDPILQRNLPEAGKEQVYFLNNYANYTNRVPINSLVRLPKLNTYYLWHDEVHLHRVVWAVFPPC